MEAKSHCKLHYGDGDDEEDAELEEFYDYSSRFLLVSYYILVLIFIPLFLCQSQCIILSYLSSYVDETGDQIVVAGETDNAVELVGGSELVITERSENTTTSRTLGSREFMRYYRQKPRPSSQNSNQIVASLSSRFCLQIH